MQRIDETEGFILYTPNTGHDHVRPTGLILREVARIRS